MKIWVITSSFWMLDGHTAGLWHRQTNVVKAFYDRDKPFAELWVQIRNKDYQWGLEHNIQPFYMMQELDLHYV